MSYKTILVHVDRSPLAAGRIDAACTLARAHGAHLVGAAMTGLTVEFYRESSLAFTGPILQSEVDSIRQSAEQALDRFEACASAAGVPYERRLSDDDAEAGLVQQARYADLVVLSQHDHSSPGAGLGRQLPEYVALNGGRPVLVLPYAGRYADFDRHALVAWDGSRAATRAVTDALPLLSRSARVTLVVFDAEQQYGVHGEQPGADIALFLARHGVKVEVLQQKTPPGLDVGDALLSLAADCGADLLVMGAYGHMRWRELALGGVTRTLLRSMTLPVLMSH